MSLVALAPTPRVASLAIAEKAESRLPALDGIRGIAVAAVLFFHVFAWTMESSALARNDWSGVAALILKATKVGWLGVDLFFVLSGFLITGILLRSREKPRYFRNFYGRRVLRIFPLYLVILLAIFAIYQGSGSFVLLSLLFLANVTSLLGVPCMYGPLWSLAVEEHFYLVWPWIIRRVRKRGVLVLAVSICVLQPIVRAVGYACGADVSGATWFRLDGLAWGAALAAFVEFFSPCPKRLRILGIIAIVAGIGLLVVGLPFGIMTRKEVIGAALQVTPPHLVFVGMVALALCSGGTALGRILSSPVLTVLGAWSYCIYLVHWMWMTLWDRMCDWVMWDLGSELGSFGGIVVRAAAVIAASLITAAISFRFFEQPILRLKRHFV